MRKILLLFLVLSCSMAGHSQVGGTDLPNLRNVRIKGTLTIGNDNGIYSLPRAKAADGYYLKMVNGFLVFAKPRMDNVSKNDTLLYVKYSCVQSRNRWRIARDTLFIDTCYSSVSWTKWLVQHVIDSLSRTIVPPGESVKGVSGTLPIVITGTSSDPVVTIPQASTNSDGYLSYPDWRTFNGKAGLTAPVFITNISTPQVTTTSNGDLIITPNGTGKVILTDTKTVTYDGIYSNTSSSAAVTIDWSRSNVQVLNLNETTSVTFTAPPGPGHLCLKIVHAANTSVYAITWPGIVKWASGTAVVPTATSGAVDISSFFYDGTYYYAMYGNDFK